MFYFIDPTPPPPWLIASVPPARKGEGQEALRPPPPLPVGLKGPGWEGLFRECAQSPPGPVACPTMPL